MVTATPPRPPEAQGPDEDPVSARLSVSRRPPARYSCPLTACPLRRMHMTRVEYVRHLAVHVNSGCELPAGTLQAIGMLACGRCRALKSATMPCECLEVARDGMPDLEKGNEEAAMDLDPPQAAQTAPVCVGTPLARPCPPPVAERMREVLGLSVSTVRHIPGPCRRDVAETLAASLRDLQTTPTLEALLRGQRSLKSSCGRLPGEERHTPNRRKRILGDDSACGRRG